jgi:SGNH hydrolase-like domain, acetyltransferase AlgX
VTAQARSGRVAKPHKGLRLLGQALVIAIITIALLEVSLRIFHQIKPLPIFATNAYQQFRLMPHAVVYGYPLNSRGFRDVEFKVEKEPGTFRILGIGDSFAFGIVPYPSNYLTLLDEALNRSGRKVELINMGVPGFNPREYLAILMHEGLELKPDMVLLSFFIGNDFTEAKKVPSLLRHSYAANALKFLYDVNTKFANFDYTNSGTYDDEGSLYTTDAYIAHERALSYIFVKRSEIFPRLLTSTMGHLGNIKRLCDRDGIRLTVVLIPDELQVDPMLQQQVAAASGFGSDAFEFDLPNAALEEELTKLGIDHLDLLPAFRAATTTTRLYKRNDTHWNVKGNALAAEVILPHVTAQVPANR